MLLYFYNNGSPIIPIKGTVAANFIDLNLRFEPAHILISHFPQIRAEFRSFTFYEISVIFPQVITVIKMSQNYIYQNYPSLQTQRFNSNLYRPIVVACYEKYNLYAKQKNIFSKSY